MRGACCSRRRRCAAVTVTGLRLVSGYRDGYHAYGMAVNHTVTDYSSQLRDNNIALLGYALALPRWIWLAT